MPGTEIFVRLSMALRARRIIVRPIDIILFKLYLYKYTCNMYINVILGKQKF